MSKSEGIRSGLWRGWVRSVGVRQKARRQRREAEQGPWDGMRECTFSQGIRQVSANQAGDPICVRVGEGAHEQVPTTGNGPACPQCLSYLEGPLGTLSPFLTPQQPVGWPPAVSWGVSSAPYTLSGVSHSLLKCSPLRSRQPCVV